MPAVSYLRKKMRTAASGKLQFPEIRLDVALQKLLLGESSLEDLSPISSQALSTVAVVKEPEQGLGEQPGLDFNGFSDRATSHDGAAAAIFDYLSKAAGIRAANGDAV